MQNCQKFIIDFWVWSYMSNIWKSYLQNHEEGFVKSKILCVGQVARAQKKSKK